MSLQHRLLPGTPGQAWAWAWARAEPDTHTLAQLTDEERPQGGLFVVVLDVHVDDVHRLAGLLLSGIQICREQSTAVKGRRTRAPAPPVSGPGVVSQA